MLVRSVIAVSVAAVLGFATPSLARPAAKHIGRHAAAAAVSAPHYVDPARVLAGTSRGFAGRTANMASIMGSDGAGTVQMRIPLQPEHPRSFRREADATASLR